ncbi:MAG: TonB-dependent receptor [Acidobacteriota bacterium]|nr:TonB-dependent receptor [Blastocatellia bacterium]MDW8412280.1 TonB-dependent receptor [Acidobacteriota bacterium]
MHRFFLTAINMLFLSLTVFAQTATISGTARLGDSGKPVQKVLVIISELGRSVETDLDGRYEFRDVPDGTYTLIAHLDRFPDILRQVKVEGAQVQVDFEIALLTQDPITVTVNAKEQSTFEAFQAVTVIDSLKLALSAQPSFGEALGNKIGDGIAKRAFGPGPARPVIRGFDGDRVLVLQDGMRIGSLASQSGDHSDPVDVLSLDRVEVVKGPATLLYGSNAVGGVVNAVTGHHELHDRPHGGLRGYLTGLGGTTNALGGGGGGLEYGRGSFLFWGSGSGQRTGNYDTPEGKIPNSQTRMTNGRGGFGYYGSRSYLSLSYSYNNVRYGVPFAGQFEGHHHDDELRHPAAWRGRLHEDHEEVDILNRATNHNLRLSGGFRSSSAIENIRYSLNYNNYRMEEIESSSGITAVGSIFRNREFSYRTYFDQTRTGRLSGTFGFSGLLRRYRVDGAEALAPPVEHNNFAAFLLEEVRLSSGVKFQFGGRVETNRYDATVFQADPFGTRRMPLNIGRYDGPSGGAIRDRAFTGFSGAAGLSFSPFENAVFVVNYTHSYRAPALEELYNYGPHIGTLTFEIGDANLNRERTDGIDLALRYSSSRLRAEANLYYYNISDFVFLAPTGEFEDGLPVAEFKQADSRFAGIELGTELKLHDYLFLNAGLDAVDAELKRTNLPLPRIPPLRGRLGLEFRYRGLSLLPETIMARSQKQTFAIETPTAGYTIFNLTASYTLFQQHAAHVFSINGFNLGNRLYRNHLSFIKDLAPEIGRGVRFTYTVRFF